MGNVMKETDSYKISHWKQYPPKTNLVYSYFESRGGVFDRTVFFGLQYLLKKHLEGVQVTPEKIEQAKKFWNAHFGHEAFNEAGWRSMMEKHGGKLPVRIRAVPEGTVVPVSNVLMTVENTDPEFWWLTNFLETCLVRTWYPVTVATNSFHIKQIIRKSLYETGDPNLVDFKCHDFGYRGVSCEEQAQIGAAAHLLSFLGTDTVAGISMLQDYYGADMCGFSIPASEHSTITSWGKDHEVDAFANMLNQYPTGLVACVSDSFDIFNACEHLWGEQLRDQILKRDGTLVIRPDSGDPATVIHKVLDILWAKFGGTVNDKGYKVLDPHVRIIQGDGIDREMIKTILFMMKNCDYSTDNIAFGTGGGLLQKFDRDTCKFAFKCSYVEVDGQPRDVWKEPITQPGKNSKRGRLKLVRDNWTFSTRGESDGNAPDELQTVFENGNILVEQSLDEIRSRANSYL